jgi:hypothetical protein
MVILMVSVTLSIPDETRELMKKYDEINWSGFVRKAIEKKTRDMVMFEKWEKESQDEQEINDWAVKLQRASRSGRLDSLKKKGLI